jgi:hypothetical protein
MHQTARRKGLKRYPFARSGVSGKRYKRKARSGRRPDAPDIKLHIFKPETVYTSPFLWFVVKILQKFEKFT